MRVPPAIKNVFYFLLLVLAILGGLTVTGLGVWLAYREQQAISRIIEMP